LWRYFSWEYERIYWSFFLCFLKFRLLWLLSFMGLYMLWRKLKRWDLLISSWNVILLWFVLCLLLGQMFLECFVINRILVLISVAKIRFMVTHVFCEGNACADKLANLWFIHRESFHLYNRFPSGLFLNFVTYVSFLLTYEFLSNLPYFCIFFNNNFFMWWFDM